MDTNVVYTGLRSQLGSAFQILSELRKGTWTAVLSNHLLHEYEEILKANSAELKLTHADIDVLLDFICARAEAWSLSSGWMPLLDDPDDEPLVQLAYDSKAKRIVTHNVRHLLPARTLGIDVLPPRDFMRIVQRP